MAITASEPQAAQESPFAPSTIEPLLFEVFAGINTSALRAGVPDKQMSWCDGFMPLAPRNLRTMYGVGSVLYTAVGKTVVFFGFANISTAPLMIVFQSDGSVIQVNTDTAVNTTILPPSTITSPSILNCGMTQWGDQYVIIVANQTNGYWVWDGTTLFQAGQIGPVLTLTNVGSGYTTTPTVTVVGGHGHGSSIVAFINSTIGIVTSISLLNPGTGYLATDTPSVIFTGGNTAGSGASITASVSGTSLVSLSIVAGGSLYSNNPSLSFVRASATIVPPSAIVTSVVGGSIVAVSITNPTFIGGAAPTVVITDTAVTASATLELMPFGVQGTAVETYQGHVWLANGSTIYFTAPGSFVNFATSAGGGNFTSGDSFLQIGYIQLISANGFLYLVGDSSINYISGVQTTGTPPETTFTNQNADPEVGSPYPASVETFGRTILFANAFGIHVCNGGQVTKVSEMLDGVYNTVTNFGGQQLCAAQAVIFGRKVWMLLSKIVDPITNTTVSKLFITDGKLWWTSGQDMTLTFVKHQEINSVTTAWGTDGTVIRTLFSTPSNAFRKVAQSRLWDAPGGYQYVKTPSRLSAVGYYNSTVTPTFSITIDNETGLANSYTVTAVPAATGYYMLPPTAVGQKGFFNGLTFYTNAADMSLVTAMMHVDVHDYRW